MGHTLAFVIMIVLWFSNKEDLSKFVITDMHKTLFWNLGFTIFTDNLKTYGGKKDLVDVINIVV